MLHTLGPCLDEKFDFLIMNPLSLESATVNSILAQGASIVKARRRG